MASACQTLGQRPIQTHRDTYEFLNRDLQPGSLRGKIAIVTGASRGIGLEISKALATAGASLACIARTQTELDKAVHQLRLQYDVNVIGIAADVAEENSPQRIVREVQEKLGPIDILINNAGIYRLNTLEHEVDFKDWWRVIEVNLRGPTALTHAVLPQMIERRTGILLALGSRSATRTAPFSTAYSASKAALLRFSQNLHCEVHEQGILSFYVQPGDVPTTIAHGSGVVNMVTASKVPRLQKVLEGSIGTYTESPRLAADTIRWLCCAQDAHLFGGRYINAEQDLEVVLEEIKKGKSGQIFANDLYTLKVDELRYTQ